MDSDKLKRHSSTHKDLLSLPEEEIREELRARHTLEVDRKEREAKQQRVEEIALQEGLTVPREIIEASPEFHDEGDLREDLMKDRQLYLDKVELGKKIDTIIDEGVIPEESLTKERKLALDLYRKQRPRFDIANMELRPWQEDALKLIDYPSD